MVHTLIQRYLLTGTFLVLVACSGPTEQEMLQNARSYLDKGELRAASIELRNTLQKNANNAEARFLLGEISMQLGDLDSAEKEFKRAVEAGWKEEEAQLEVAKVLFARREFQKVLDQIKTREDWSPAGQANLLAVQALAHASLGDIAAARDSLEQGAKFDKGAFHIYKSTATLQLANMLPGDSIATLEEALTIYANDPELLLLYANARLLQNDLDQAAATYQKIIELDPSSSITVDERKAYLALSRLHLAQNKLDLAESSLKPLLKRNRDDPEANYLTGMLAFEQKDYNLAEAHMRKLLKLAPGHLESQQLMGKIKYALEDYDQAAHHLSTYLAEMPDDLAIRKLLASTYIELHQPDFARSTLHPALMGQSVDAGVLLLLSKLEFSRGNVEAGIRVLESAVAANPDSPSLRKRLAVAYITIGKTQRALQALKAFGELADNKQEAGILMITAYLKAGRNEKASELAHAMLQAAPEDPAIIALNGKVYAASGDQQQARIYFKQALELDHGQLSASLGLAEIERKEGNLEQSIEIYKQLVKLNKGGSVPLLALAVLSAQQGDEDAMLSWLEKARESAPEDIRSRIILSNYYFSTKQYEKAGQVIREVISLAPDNAETLALQGRNLIARKRYKEALQPLKTLVATIPRSADARTLLGEAHARLGKINDAHEQLSEALDIDPDNVPALGLMSEIELKKGNSEKSLKHAMRLQHAQPDLYQGHKLEGDVWLSRKEYASASAAYNRAWDRQHTAALAIAMYRSSIQSLGLDSAVQPVLTWLKSNPDDTATRFFLATAYLQSNRVSAAIREYEKLLGTDPDNLAVLNNLAWLYSIEYDPRALEMANRAYQSSPDNPGIQDTFGWTLVQHGQLDKGVRILSEALDQLPDNREVRYHHAAALLKSGKTEEGARLLSKLLAEGKPFSGKEDAERLLNKYNAAR